MYVLNWMASYYLLHQYLNNRPASRDSTGWLPGRNGEILGWFRATHPQTKCLLLPLKLAISIVLVVSINAV